MNDSYTSPDEGLNANYSAPHQMVTIDSMDGLYGLTRAFLDSVFSVNVLPQSIVDDLLNDPANIGNVINTGDLASNAMQWIGGEAAFTPGSVGVVQ